MRARSARGERFPWADAMEAGLGTLRLSPPVFWAMTPRELEAALRGALGVARVAQPMKRAELSALMTAYPDLSSTCRQGRGLGLHQ